MALWELYEGSHHYDTIQAVSADDALDIARSNVDPKKYDKADRPLRIDVLVRSEDTGEEARDTVTCDPNPPTCSDGAAHEWERPAGGGVRGHGGGAIISEVCPRCGIVRTTDNWAHHPSAGRPGLTSASDATEQAASSELRSEQPSHSLTRT
ncbi:MAG: hypothetical protein ABSC94_22575 [Polyangiaceae bacterium]|jgi:hypothetical protein